MATLTAYTSSPTLGEILLRVYDRGNVTELQNLESPLLSRIGDAVDFTIGGDDFRFGVNTEGDESFGYIAEDAALPEAYNETVLQAAITPVVFVGQVKFTGLARAVSQRNEHAFLAAVQYHTDQKLRRMVAYKEGALFRDGVGRLGLCAGAVGASATVTVDNPGVQWFRPGMRLDFIDTGDTVDASAAIVDSVNWVTNQIVLTAAITTDDNSAIYFDSLGQTTYAGTVKEILGLSAGVATSGTYLGIARATNATFQGNVVDASSNPLTEDLLLRGENRVKVIGGVGSGNMQDYILICHPNQIRKYFELVQPQKQFTGLSLDAGYTSLAWNGHTIVDTYNCPETEVYYGDMSQFQRFVAPGGEMQIDTTFGPPIKWTPGYDAGALYWRCYENYALRKPNAWVKTSALQNVGTR